MKEITILNEKNQVIFNNAYMTENFLDRLIGLMDKKELKEDEALCIKPCNSIHMFFMRFPIDVIFLDEANHVIKLIEGFKPWRTSGLVRKSRIVIEMPCCAIIKKGIKLNDKIIILTTNSFRL